MGLKRQLNFVEVLAMSVALMAPTAGMALNTPFVAQTAGIAVPFIYVLSTIAIVCVAIAFIRLTRRFNDAGSVYGLTKNAMGPRYGFMAGWNLALTYVLFIGALLAGFATFADLLISELFHVNVPWGVTVAVGAAGVWYFGFRSIKLSAHAFMICEGISVLLMFGLAAVIVAKGGDGGAGLSLAPLKPSAASIGGLSAALVFGIMTFLGFEGSATMGEESEKPEIAVPLSVLSAVLLAGVVFICISYAQTIGFGLTDAGAKAYAKSAAPVTDLALKFVGNPFAIALNVGAALSTFACALASADGAARVLYSLGRDRCLPSSLARVHPKHASPHVALAVSIVIGTASALVFMPFTQNPSDVYGWTSALATLAVIVAYGMTSIASLAYFWQEDIRKMRFYQFIPPVVSIPLLIYTFYSQVIPVPSSPLNYWPYVEVAYVALGLVVLSAQGRKRNATRPNLAQPSTQEIV